MVHNASSPDPKFKRPGDWATFSGAYGSILVSSCDRLKMLDRAHNIPYKGVT